jgi:hypothetical protein
MHSESARNRIYDGLKKYGRIVTQARQRGMNQQDTGDIVKAMLGDMLGFDPFFDVTAESSVRGPNADHAIVLEGNVKLLLIVRGIGIVPNAAHLLRLSGSGTPSYAEWVVVTNADVWICYRLGVGTDRHPEMVCRASLLDARPAEEKIATFLLLSKEGMQQDALLRHWERSHALNPGKIVGLLLGDDVLNVLRRELQRTVNVRPDRRVLIDILIREIIRPEVLAASQIEPSAPRLPRCYAYVADPNDPQTWRLQYRNPDGTPDPDRLIAAAAAVLSDARALQIPADDIALVKQRLREAYIELGVAQDDLPPGLRT